jgi:hypothetical protein
MNGLHRKQNAHPLEQVFKKALAHARQEQNPEYLYSLQLLKWALENHKLEGPWDDDQYKVLEQVRMMFHWKPENIEKALYEGLNPDLLDPKDPLQLAMWLAENLHIVIFENNNPA